MTTSAVRLRPPARPGFAAAWHHEVADRSLAGAGRRWARRSSLSSVRLKCVFVGAVPPAGSSPGEPRFHGARRYAERFGGVCGAELLQHAEGQDVLVSRAGWRGAVRRAAAADPGRSGRPRRSHGRANARAAAAAAGLPGSDGRNARSCGRRSSSSRATTRRPNHCTSRIASRRRHASRKTTAVTSSASWMDDVSRIAWRKTRSWCRSNSAPNASGITRVDAFEPPAGRVGYPSHL